MQTVDSYFLLLTCTYNFLIFRVFISLYHLNMIIIEESGGLFKSKKLNTFQNNTNLYFTKGFMKNGIFTLRQ